MTLLEREQIRFIIYRELGYIEDPLINVDVKSTRNNKDRFIYHLINVDVKSTRNNKDRFIYHLINVDVKSTRNNKDRFIYH